MSAIFISHSTKDNADTEAMARWLKQQGHTSYFIDYDEQSGIRAGTDWAQVLYQRLRQCQAVIALVTPNWLESKWCFGEMVMARENGKPIFPIKLKPCELPGLLSDLIRFLRIFRDFSVFWKVKIGKTKISTLAKAPQAECGPKIRKLDVGLNARSGSGFGHRE
jgi:TIR domain